MSIYRYRKLFDDKREPEAKAAPKDEVGDRTRPEAYVFDESILLCVNLALATGRPLLVRGPPGCGKSSLARAVAKRAAWSFYAMAVTSRTQASDLLYEIDHLKRLQDAYRRKLTDDLRPYIRPGPLFWGFDQCAARELLEKTARLDQTPPDYEATAARSVVLLDEIDKADPDVPNNLLAPLGQLRFDIPGFERPISANSAEPPLIVLTTNEERDLPPAFLRRCVELRIPELKDDEENRSRLLEIARRHDLDLGNERFRILANLFFQAARPAERPANTGEFLDLLRAWRILLAKEKEETGNENDVTLMAVLNAIVHGSNDEHVA